MKSLKTNFDDTVKQVRKKLGNELVLLLDSKELPQVEVLSTGSLVVDDLLGIAGLPKGRVIEIFGPESSGKTTMALSIISQTQKSGGLCAFIDAEHSIDIDHAKRLGIDLNNLVLSQPSTGEEAFEMIEILCKTGNVDLIVLDSVAALLPEAELNGEIRDQSIGLQARLMSRALRRITGLLNKNKTTLLFINQVRERVGVVFGNPEITSGGRALKFYSSIRIEVRKGGQILKLGEVIGHQTKIKIVKNKLAPPYKSGTIDVYFSEGINQENDLIVVAEKYSVLEKNGSWYIFKKKNIVQGKSKLINVLKENLELAAEIKKETLAAMRENLKKEIEKTHHF